MPGTHSFMHGQQLAVVPGRSLGALTDTRVSLFSGKSTVHKHTAWSMWLLGIAGCCLQAVAGAALCVAALMNAPPGFLEFLLCVPWRKLSQLYPK
jgi:hypothetical protein